MTIHERYSKALAKQLNRHAVWQPGHPVLLGDYGTLQKGVFLKLGNIADFARVDRIVSSQSKASKLVFTSNGTTTAFVKADGAGGFDELGTVDARFRIKFQDEYSIYLRGSGVRSESITNLRAVTTQLREIEEWSSSWTIVSNLTVAKLLSVILAGGRNAEVFIHASVGVLEQLESGEVDATAKLQISGQSGYSSVGASGPFLFELVKLRTVFGGIKTAALPGHEFPFEMVPANP
jgi:hypothetical protein